MPTTLDNLIATSKIPSTVAVPVNTSGDRRLNDLIPNPQFADFMAKELIPWVRSHYHVTNDPANLEPSSVASALEDLQRLIWGCATRKCSATF